MYRGAYHDRVGNFTPSLLGKFTPALTLIGKRKERRQMIPVSTPQPADGYIAMSNHNEIKTRIMSDLYQTYFKDPSVDFNHQEWAENNDLDHQLVSRAVEELSEEDLIETGFGGYIDIRAKGIYFVEEICLADSDLINQNKQIRSDILKIFAEARRERGPHATVTLETLQESIEYEEVDFNLNLTWLIDARYFNPIASGLFELTHRGREKIDDYLVKLEISKRFKELRDGDEVSPQARGHEFEELLERSAQREGWQTDRNVLGRGEEIDIVLNKGSEYYLVSCKWVRDPVESNAIRDLRDRVTGRPGTRGIVASMSGFTQSAIQNAQERIESAIILLFGKSDIERLLVNGDSFDELLQSKLNAAIVARSIQVD